MAKWIVRPTMYGGVYRVCVPRRMAVAGGWHEEKYVIVDDSIPDMIIIRRLSSERKETENRKRAFIED